MVPFPGRAAALILFVPWAGAQVPAVELIGDDPGGEYGYGVAFVGDLNADGVEDFAVGSPEIQATGGRVRVYSGADLQVLLDIVNPGPLDAEFGEVLAAAGDVDADGVPDLLVGAPDALLGRGIAYVFSGADGSMIHTFEGTTYGARLGFALAGLGDVDGDGTPDFAIAAPYPTFDTDPRVVYVRSGRNGSLIWSISEPSGLDNYLGGSLRALGDLDGDGRSELAVSAAPTPPQLSSGALVLSGATGRVLYRETAQWFNVGAAGDVDLDGVPDWLAVNPSGARLRSGADGSLIHEWTGFREMTGAGDVTGDGVPDLWGMEHGSAGYAIRLIDGATRIPSAPFGAGPHYSFIAGGADVTGDGRPDLLDGRPTALANLGKVTLWSLGCSADPIASYCTAAPNSAGAGALMGASGSSSVGANDLVLETSGCPPAQAGLYLFGAHEADVPFGDGRRCIAAPFFRLGPPVSTGGGTALRALDLDGLPGGAPRILAGSQWRFQLWYRDPGFGAFGFNLSDGLAVEFCP